MAPRLRDRRQRLLRTLINGRLDFTPMDGRAYRFEGVGASLMPASWNQIVPWLRQIDGLRRAA
jgi:hypothetical protein